MNFLGDWDAKTTNIIAICLLSTALFLLFILCGLAIYFCRKRILRKDSNPIKKDSKSRFSRSPWTETSILSKFDNSPDSSCMNDGFDISDETTPKRIEQRRYERQKALFCEDIRADAPARFDRSMGRALAVEKLLRDSYVFDTHILERPEGDVQIIAAKRDYL